MVRHHVWVRLVAAFVAIVCGGFASAQVTGVWSWGANDEGQLGDGSLTDRPTAVHVAGLTGVVSVSAGWYHSLALKDDGTVWAWGWNLFGQLGDGTTTDRLTPVQVQGLSNVVEISAGAYHSLARLANGQVWAWGRNENGRLDDGTTTDRLAPVRVSGLSSVVQISAGMDHSLARLEGGSVRAWGGNGTGQLGDGTTTERWTPVAVTGLTNARHVAAGANHSAAALTDGTVWGWGWNARGQLGDGTWIDKHTPVQAVGVTNAVAVAASSHTLALRSNGTVWGWGWNVRGQLGDGNTDMMVLLPAQTQISNVKEIAVGILHSIAAKHDGTVWAWGGNDYGALGDGTEHDRLTPVQTVGLSAVTAIAANGFHNLVVGVGIPSGSGPTLNPIGDRDVDEETLLAFTVSGSDPGGGALTFSLDAASLAAGMTLDATTGAFAWTPSEAQDGVHSVTITVANAANETASETFSITVREVNRPPVLDTLLNQSLLWLATFSFTVTASDPDTVNPGAVPNTLTYSLDQNSLSKGMSIDATTGKLLWVPNPMQEGVHQVTVTVTDDGTPSLSASATFGINHMRRAGAVYAWGQGWDGSLGLGRRGGSPLPERVLVPPTAVQVSGHQGNGSTNHTLSLHVDGTVWAWGRNQRGQLGDGTTEDRSTPVQVAGLTDIVQVAAGANFSAALRADGTVWTWGANENGELGRGYISGALRLSPEMVSGISGVVAIAATSAGVLALREDGTVWAWGHNHNFALGLPFLATGSWFDENRYSVPTITRFPSGVRSLSAGPSSSIVLQTDGTVWSVGRPVWHANGTNVYDSTLGLPVQVPDVANAVRINDGGSVRSIVLENGTLLLMGDNGDGQLGDGTTTKRWYPGPVSGFSDRVLQSTSGSFHTLAVRDDGTLWSWGSNYDGQLGLGSDRGEYLTPHQVPGLQKVFWIDAPDRNSFAILEVNDPPVLDPVGDKEINELAPFTFTVTATDPNLDAINFSLDAQSAGKGMSLNPTTGVFTWTPSEQQDGVHTVTVTVKDTGFPQMSDSATFTITVREVNVRPNIAPIADKTVDEHTLLTFVATATDPDFVNPGAAPNTLTFSLDQESLAKGMVIAPATGVFTWTPNESQDGQHSVTVTVTDDGTPQLSHSVTFAITVIEVNEAPVLDPIGDRSVDELAALSFAVAASDPDTVNPGAMPNTLTFSLDATSIAKGMSLDSQTGAFSWTPTEAQDGAHSVTITVSDGALTDSETFTILVNEVNLAPTIDPISSQFATQGALLTFTATASDADTVNPSAMPNVLTFTLDADSLSKGMAIAPLTGVFQWTPTAFHGGIHMVTITVTDDGSPELSDSVTFTIYSDRVRNVWGWGFNDGGQVGDGTTLNRIPPTTILEVAEIVQVSAGMNHSLALRSDGRVWAWGGNNHGAVGDGTTIQRHAPVWVAPMTDVVSVAAGAEFSLALRSDGSVWGWGRNNHGQLGDLTTTDRWSPIQIPEASAIVAIAAGGGHSLALAGDGKVWSWGRNEFGQLGNGLTNDRPLPFPIVGLDQIVAISAGESHSMALRADGTVWVWGRNNTGQLGDGTTTNRLTPVLVHHLSQVTAIAAGWGHSVASRADGTAWAWGANGLGQIGDGTTVDRWTPVQTAGLGGVAAVSAGAGYSLALHGDGTMSGWGWNASGQLGDGTTATRTTPVQVVGVGQVTSMSAGGGHGLATTGLLPMVRGTVVLQDLSGSPAGLSVTVEVRALGSGAVLDSRQLVLDADGNFAMPTLLQGDYQIAVRGSNWLRHAVGPVHISDTGVSGLSFNLINGDVTGDNTINIQDFLALRLAFGSMSGTQNWNPNADLNKDGVVNIADLLILRKNFGRSGD